VRERQAEAESLRRASLDGGHGVWTRDVAVSRPERQQVEELQLGAVQTLARNERLVVDALAELPGEDQAREGIVQDQTETDGIWTGGDNINLGIATTSIGQGRKAAESIHASLQDLKLPEVAEPKPIGPDKVRLDWYEAKTRGERKVKEPEERLAAPFDEVDLGFSQEQALEETTRCFSCGKCFGCENCWMYCQNNCFVKLPEAHHGHFYKIKLEVCDGCKKCWEECPCGFILGE
jgi:Pyruvate/2-oxoacid:ferredoxin oxidoreductase delta subunit